MFLMPPMPTMPPTPASIVFDKITTTVPKGLKHFTFPAQIGVDEVGRGSLISRVYVAAVVLPTHCDFNTDVIKDSKKIHKKVPTTINPPRSRRKTAMSMSEIAEYIKTIAIAWDISYETEETIDEINILRATLKAMHKSIGNVVKQLKSQGIDCKKYNATAWIDGSYFDGFDPETPNDEELLDIHWHTVEKGDNTLLNIAAASILAKNARDTFLVNELCPAYPKLAEVYNIHKNMGYGTGQHLQSIRQYGITQFHRKTYGICKTSTLNIVNTTNTAVDYITPTTDK